MWKVTSIQKMTPKYKGTPRPAVAVAGKSNVGKSTLINNVLGKKIANTSKTPGRTRGVHRFLINEQWDLVDLPGYGYAKVGMDLKMKFRDMVTNFLSGHGNLRQLIVLVDIRRGVGEIDFEMIEWAEHEGVGVTVILTKSDKLKNMHKKKALQDAKKALEGRCNVFTHSSTKGDGHEILKKKLVEWYSVDAFGE